MSETTAPKAKRRSPNILKVLGRTDPTQLLSEIRRLENQLRCMKALYGVLTDRSESAVQSQDNGHPAAPRSAESSGATEATIEQRIERLLTRYGQLSVTDLAAKLAVTIHEVKDALRASSRFRSVHGAGVTLV